MELPQRDMLRPGEIAQFLRVSVRTVYRLCKADLPTVTWRGVSRIPRADFLDWYASKTSVSVDEFS